MLCERLTQSLLEHMEIERKKEVKKKSTSREVEEVQKKTGGGD